ncbi:hypothetical protein [[Clostridium] scindens]
MNDKSFGPSVANKLEDTENIKILILAFPIWLAYHKLIQCTL